MLGAAGNWSNVVTREETTSGRWWRSTDCITVKHGNYAFDDLQDA